MSNQIRTEGDCSIRERQGRRTADTTFGSSLCPAVTIFWTSPNASSAVIQIFLFLSYWIMIYFELSISVGELHFPLHPKGLSKLLSNYKLNITSGYTFHHYDALQWHFSILPTIILQAADLFCVYGRLVRERWDDLSSLF